MKWFKHYSDMHDGRTISDLMEQMGHMGLCFFLLQEICAEKLERKSDESLTEADCLFHFPARNVRQKLRISQTNLVRLLDICQTNGQLQYSFSGSELEIKMPILLNLLDSDSKKARQTRAEAAAKSRLDKEEDKDKEREKIKNKNLPATKKPDPLNSQIWEAYKLAYFQRYKVEPVRNAKVNSNISQLAKRLGPDSIEVVKFYLSHNEGFYLKNLHPISLCLKDCEGLRTQMLRARPITSVDVRNFEKQQNISNLTKAVRDGENF